MLITEAFPSKYLKTADLQGRSIRCKIQNAVTEKIGDDTKLVLYFVGKEKGMVCNRTNGMTLAEVWGPETDNWTGADIEIFSMKVPFQGKLTDSLRVRPLPTAPMRPRQAPPPQPNSALAVVPPPASQDDYGAIDDSDIPF